MPLKVGEIKRKILNVVAKLKFDEVFDPPYRLAQLWSSAAGGPALIRTR